jgi:hypothetical protein
VTQTFFSGRHLLLQNHTNSEVDTSVRQTR